MTVTAVLPHPRCAGRQAGKLARKEILAEEMADLLCFSGANDQGTSGSSWRMARFRARFCCNRLLAANKAGEGTGELDMPHTGNPNKPVATLSTAFGLLTLGSPCAMLLITQEEAVTGTTIPLPNQGAANRQLQLPGRCNSSANKEGWALQRPAFFAFMANEFSVG